MHSVSGAAWYVAVGGDDGAAGTFAAPLASLAEASTRAQAGDEIILRGGRYVEVLVPAGSGVEGAPIVYRANVEGETVEAVTVTAFERIEPGVGGVGEWVQHAGNIYKIQLGAGHTLPAGQNMVKMGDEVLAEARWPNGLGAVDFRRAQMQRADGGGLDMGSNTGDGVYTGWYDDAALGTFAEGAWVGGYVQLVTGMGWWTKTGRVTASTSGQVQFRYAVTDTGREAPSAMDPYYLFGRLAALDSAGEYFLDTAGLDGAAHQLYVWVEDGVDPNSLEIYTKRWGQAADLSGCSYIELRDIVFEGGRILLNNTAHNNVIRRCEVRYGAYDSNLYDAWDGAARGAIHAAGTGHLIEDSTVLHSMAHGIALINSGVTVRNCVVGNTWGHGIKTDGSRAMQVSDNTCFEGGTTLISLNGKASQIVRNHVYRGGLHITDVELMNAYNSGDAEGTEIAWNWLHDNQAEDDPQHSWNGGGGIRLDSGGAVDGCSNYRIHHNVVWDAGARGISTWALSPGMVNYGTAEGAQVYIYNNTVNGDIGIRAEADATGIRIQNNLYMDTLVLNNAVFAEQAQLSENLHAGLGDFEAALANRYRLAVGSAAIDAGVVIDGVTDGFVGAGPDLGAYEHGGAAWVPGARMNMQQMAMLQYRHAYRKDGTPVIVVEGLPLGRTLPDGFRLRLNGDQELTQFERRWDFATARFTAEYPFDPGALAGEMHPSIEHSLAGGDYAQTAQQTVAIVRPRIEGLSAAALRAGETLRFRVEQGSLQRRYRIPLAMTDYRATDLRLAPLTVRFDSAALIAAGWLAADGSDLAFEAGDTGLRLDYHIEAGWNTTDTVVWLRYPKYARTFIADAEFRYYLSCGGPRDYAGEQTFRQLLPDFPDSEVLLWLRPDSIETTAGGVQVTRWADVSGNGYHATQTEVGLRPQHIAGSGQASVVAFDGDDDYLWVGDLPYAASGGDYTVYAVYRAPEPGSVTYQRIFSGRPENPPDPTRTLDYQDGLAVVPLLEPDGRSTVREAFTVLSLGRNAKYPDDVVISGMSQGAQHPTQNRFKGELAEILVLDIRLDDAARLAMESAYFGRKYGMAERDLHSITLDLAHVEMPDVVSVGGIDVQEFSLSDGGLVELQFPDFGTTAQAISVKVTLAGGGIATHSEALFSYQTQYDGWRLFEFANVAGGPLAAGTEPQADWDGDGVGNFMEWALGGDPQSVASAPVPIIVEGADGVQLQFTLGHNAANVDYAVQYSADCVQWDLLPEYRVPDTAEAGAVITVPIVPPTPDGKIFQRLAVSAP